MALLFLVAAGGEAQAGLTICNKAKRAARVALGRFDGLSWVSEGWWSIAPGACEALVKVPLDARYYYLYGTDGAAGVWDGDTAFCTSRQEKFSIVGRAACERRGYDRNRFFRIDTGDSLDKVQTLQ
ncbi:MAG TPA: DUF1036 domain-containing protein [Rhizomicrobium sp.]|nr:DUF1036 domain-containing protein [Rhizomicrobium sp.]